MSEKSENEYLVRGALLKCSKGSHKRRVNLLQCHGVYAKESPLLREDDCIVEENITYFGICSSNTPPKDAKTVKLTGGESEQSSVQGLKCTPEIVGKWNDTCKETNVTGDKPALTMKSYLVCNCGGIIEPVTSGQEYED